MMQMTLLIWAVDKKREITIQFQFIKKPGKRTLNALGTTIQFFE